MRSNPGKSGARVDHESVRVDWCLIWARVLPMLFGTSLDLALG